MNNQQKRAAIAAHVAAARAVALEIVEALAQAEEHVANGSTRDFKASDAVNGAVGAVMTIDDQLDALRDQLAAIRSVHKLATK